MLITFPENFSMKSMVFFFRPFGKMKGSDRKLSNNLEGIDHRRMNLQGKDFGMQILLVDLR